MNIAAFVPDLPMKHSLIPQSNQITCKSDLQFLDVQEARLRSELQFKEERLGKLEYTLNQSAANGSMVSAEESSRNSRLSVVIGPHVLDLSFGQ